MLGLNITGKSIKLLILCIRILTDFLSSIESKLYNFIGNGTGEMFVALPVSKNKLKLDLRGDLRKQVFLFGALGYESETLPIWVKLAKSADIIIDIGAHVGYFSILANDANQNANVYAFEPLPENFLILNKNVKHLKTKDKIHTYQVAISKETGLAEMLVKGSSGSTLAEEFWEDREQLSKITIKATTLDTWCAENNVNLTEKSLIKIDVETFEPEVFKGATNALSKYPAVLCEVLATFVEEELNKIFPPESWRYFWLSPEGPAERKRIVGDPSWNCRNYLFIPRNSPFLALVPHTSA